jgi:nucleoside-diphosphate-sugar epimerase
MAMPDAIEALLKLAHVSKDRLSRRVYNISAFSPSAEEIRDVVVSAFPAAAVSTVVDEKRQLIVDSWPEDVDVSAARRDWGHAPQYDFERAFRDYLIPTIRKRYA